MNSLRDLLADRATRLAPDLAAAAVIFAASAAGALLKGTAGAAAFALACVLSALLPFPALIAIAASVWTLPLVKLGVVVSDIRPDEILLLVALAGALVRVFIRRDLVPTGIEKAFVVFLGLSAVSAALTHGFGSDVSLRSLALPLGRQLLHLLLFMLVVWAVKARPKRLAAVAGALAVGGTASALLGIAQYYSGPVHAWIARTYLTLDAAFSYPYLPGSPGFRATSAFDGNPNHLGVALVMMALFSGAMATRAHSRRDRMAWAAGSVVMLAAVLLTTSRASFLTALGVLAVATLVWRSGVMATVTGVWMAFMALLPNEMPQRVLDLFGTKTPTGAVVADPSVSGRIEMMAESGAPAPGGLPMHDNFYLDLYHNFGVLALAGFLWLALVVGRRLMEATRQHPGAPGYLRGALLAAVALALVSFTGGFFETQRVAEVFWMLMGTAFAWLADAEGGGSA